ncbi:MAG: hypothetical protein ACFFCM_20210 [Promethearchaeota archaeon]
MRKIENNLINILESYKNNSYEFGEYKTKDDLTEAAIGGKTFVFKGQIVLKDFCIFCLASIFLIFMISFVIFINDFLTQVLIIIIMGLGICIFICKGIYTLLLKFKLFFIVAKEGILIENLFGIKSYLWSNIVQIKQKFYQYGNNKHVQTKIYFLLKNNRVMSIYLDYFKNEEIISDDWQKLLFNLCEIYYEMSQKKINKNHESQIKDYYRIKRLKKIIQTIGTFILYISFYKLMFDFAFMFSFSNLGALSDSGKVLIAIVFFTILSFAIFLNFKAEPNHQTAHNNIDIILGINNASIIVLQWIIDIFFISNNIDGILISFISFLFLFNFVFFSYIWNKNEKIRIFEEDKLKI